jgi:hypothetical protein
MAGDRRARLAAGWALLATAVACCAGAADDQATRESRSIVGGQPAGAAWQNVMWLEAGCTATLIHPEVIAFAAHCGINHTRVWQGTRFGPDGPLPSATGDSEAPRSWPIDRCAAWPGGDINNGADLALCVLAAPLGAAAPVPPLSGCERTAVVPGAEVVLVGFGRDALTGGTLGVKRTVTSTIRQVGKELLIGSDEKGSCHGDSGSPAFIRVPTEGPGERGREWRLAGVLSAGIAGRCGEGYYVDVAAFEPWLEAASQRDVAPCFDGGRWRPTAACVAPAVGERGERATASSSYARTCGPGFRAVVPDDQAPRLEVARVACQGADSLCLAISADDGAAGWGVRAVRAQLLAGKTVIEADSDEVPPYELALSGQGSAVHVLAVDHAGNARTIELSLGEGGCTFASVSARASTGVVAPVLTALLGIALRAGTARRRRGGSSLSASRRWSPQGRRTAPTVPETIRLFASN